MKFNNRLLFHDFDCQLRLSRHRNIVCTSYELWVRPLTYFTFNHFINGTDYDLIEKGMSSWCSCIRDKYWNCEKHNTTMFIVKVFISTAFETYRQPTSSTESFCQQSRIFASCLSQTKCSYRHKTRVYFRVYFSARHERNNKENLRTTKVIFIHRQLGFVLK